MRVHRLAAYFPILEGEELDQLAKDINDNGQLEPIVMFKGEILDGVNRWTACERLGIDPITKEYEGSDPLRYVISSNVRRRHLDKSQRAMIATEMLPEFEADAEKRRVDMRAVGSTDPTSHRNYGEEESRRSRAEAAQEFGVSGPSVQRAKRVKEQAPERVDEIVSGETSVFAVDEELRKAEAVKRAKERVAKGIEKKKKEHPKEVKEFLDAMRVFEEAAKFAVVMRDIFAPESKQFITTKFEKIQSSIEELVQ